jgi:hypothetical protein
VLLFYVGFLLRLQLVDPILSLEIESDHKRFTLKTDINVYFSDPRYPWKRGPNENTNGLLKQYFPEGTDLSKTLKLS